jgi:Xaa-Pro aminopeptidase
MLQAKLKGFELRQGDMALSLSRSQKSEWELDIMRRCGALHHQGLHELLPRAIRPGMTEREIAHKAWEVFFSLGHMGILRMQSHGEEIFLGHVSAGNSGNYPGSFNGPLGVAGEHPAMPYMGSASTVWEPGTPLSCDIGFALEGYCTDKTQVYWGGSAKEVDPDVRAAHSFGMDVQAWLAEHVKPGAIPSELYAGCLKLAEKAGMAEGFMGLDGNKVVFVGHGIGLSIDGYPVIAKGFDRPLEQGNTLALEPKQAVRGKCMVGVENTFEVTATGCRCITGDDYDMVCVG